MHYETVSLIVQIATLGVLLLTLRAANRYVKATNEIKKAAFNQVETSLMPK